MANRRFAATSSRYQSSPPRSDWTSKPVSSSELSLYVTIAKLPIAVTFTSLGAAGSAPGTTAST